MEIKVGDKVIFEHRVLGDVVGFVKEIYTYGDLSMKEYNVHTKCPDGVERAFVVDEVRLAEEEIKTNPEEYELKIDVAHNIVIAMLLKNGEEIARGHGHIIHGGDIGIAQAISYACKRIWFELGGNYDDK